MTLMIILGAVAGLYLIALLFRLAAIALPIYAGIGAGFWLLDHGYGHGTSITAGLITAVLVLLLGRLLCATLPPIPRGTVALVFAVPAGFAGYQAARVLAELALTNDIILTLLGAAGAVAAAAAAGRSLGVPRVKHRYRDGPSVSTASA